MPLVCLIDTIWRVTNVIDIDMRHCHAVLQSSAAALGTGKTSVQKFRSLNSMSEVAEEGGRLLAQFSKRFHCHRLEGAQS